jgi:hypothetical protein
MYSTFRKYVTNTNIGVEEYTGTRISCVGVREGPKDK